MNELPRPKSGDLRYTIVVACATNLAIGKNNSLPWHLPEDLKYFKQRTIGKVLVMGGNTFRSLPRLLSDRYHIVVSRSEIEYHPHVSRAGSLNEAHRLAQQIARKWSPQGSLQQPSEIMVIGGAQIYAAWLPITSCVEMTQIDKTVDGDVFFPRLDLRQWSRIKQPWIESSVQGLRCRFVTLRRL